ncbi:DNA-binding transcriptional regulator, PadR family [Bryocella elongata]|uniref:DNA-binding transcriptional regulator, PadR family n=1 Tax=Bryocella elongata TaxID=863522 RepID=A0A1H6C6Q9_9BACT|nr:PadR family transcriptional regulator [Bryocella elongata]SEG68598.1 DNA-binding transcriptional regulator, PadR family [Bryocella elongata]
MWNKFIHHAEREGFGGRGCGPREHAFAMFGRRGFGPGRHERGFGGRERLFDGGELQLLILQLLAEKPSYGYELIKAIEQRMGGGYAPSPGVIYPTLTLLEERGFARIEPTEGSRKVYGITDEGRAELTANADRLREVTDRVDNSGEAFHGGRSPLIRQAFQELRGSMLRAALRAREAGKPVTQEQVEKILEAIRTAARTIDTM